jgi:hypothetical protein
MKNYLNRNNNNPNNQVNDNTPNKNNNIKIKKKGSQVHRNSRLSNIDDIFNNNQKIGIKMEHVNTVLIVYLPMVMRN